VDLLVVNRVEATMMTALPEVDVDTGEDVEPSILLDPLLESVSGVVVTAGADGAWYGDRAGARVHVPAPVVDAVDTTGAGDAFIGALAVAWGRVATWWTRCAGERGRGGHGAAAGRLQRLPQRSVIEELYLATYGAGADG